MNPKNGIGLSLAWLVVASILPIIAFSGGMAWMFIDRQKTAVEHELADTTRALMVAVDRQLDSEITAMRVIASGYRSDKNDLTFFRRRARDVMAEHPTWLDVVLIETDSHTIVEGALPIPSPPPVSSAPEAIDEVVATGRPVIVGAFRRGKIINRPMILLMVPVKQEVVVRYVLTVVLDQTAVSGIFTDQNLPPGWTCAVVDSHMRLAGRSRNPEQFVGLPATPFAG